MSNRTRVTEHLFTSEELDTLRRGFYTQAPTVAALILGTYDTDYSMDVVAGDTVELIEALIEHLAEVKR